MIRLHPILSLTRQIPDLQRQWGWPHPNHWRQRKTYRVGGDWPGSFHRYTTVLDHIWTQKSALAYCALTTQRTASGPSSIVQPGRWSTQSIPRMTWSTRRSCSIWSSKGSPSSTSSTSSCLARSYPHWWCWPTSCLHKVWKSIPLNQNIIPWEGDKIRFYQTIHHWGEMIPPETRTCCTEERFDRGERDECCSISCSVHDWISETSLPSRLSWLVLPTHVILYYQVNLI